VTRLRASGLLETPVPRACQRRADRKLDQESRTESGVALSSGAMSDGSFLEHCGCRLQYCLAGSGPPVVFIQGVAVHGNGWSAAGSARRGCRGFRALGGALSRRVRARPGGSSADRAEAAVCDARLRREIAPRGAGGHPTLVVAGAHDPIAPPALGRQIAAVLPGARYVEMADASHGAPIQHPERINELLMDHFERAGSSWPTRQ
jgi:hypothetical protein